MAMGERANEEREGGSALLFFCSNNQKLISTYAVFTSRTCDGRFKHWELVYKIKICILY